jgi:hypothetical protein
MTRIARSLLAYGLAAPILILASLWASAAIWIDGPLHGAAGVVIAAIPPSATLFALIRFSFRRAFFVGAVVLAGVAGWWSSIEPSNDRDWLADVARPPTAQFDGDLVTIHNVRNFDYRSENEYTERWEDRTYDLSKIEGVDFFLSYWGSPWIAHTIVSWPFSDGRHLAISIETRKEKGEAYSAVLGFFRQFELYYVVADERDVIRLRTNYRGEDVYLYRLKTQPDTARALLMDYLKIANELAVRPQWYNALTHNCTTTIRRHAQHVAPGNPFDWRILVNGKLDELGYERGTIDTGIPFDELRRLSNVTERAKAADQSPEFSNLIRQGLPPRPR